MATADSYHGKEGVLTIEYPDPIQYKDVTTATNNHFAMTDADTVPDADPETVLGGAEYSDANYQTIGVNDTNSVDKATVDNGDYAMHYFKILLPTASENVTKIKVEVHGAANPSGSQADGWNLKLWDATGNDWGIIANTNETAETELQHTITDSTDITIAEAAWADGDDDYIFLCAQSKGADDGSDSNMNIYWVETKVWYARTIAFTKGWEAKVEFANNELYTQDSILRQDVVRTDAGVLCSFDRAKFDGVLTAQILGTVDMDQDIDGSTSAGRSRGQIRDTSAPLKCTFRGTVTSGSNTQLVRVDNVVFDGINFNAPETDWVIQNFAGRGDQIYTEYAT